MQNPLRVAWAQLIESSLSVVITIFFKYNISNQNLLEENFNTFNKEKNTPLKIQ